MIQINNPTHSNDRIYSEDGISPTLNTMQGGNRQPFIQQRPRGKNAGNQHTDAPTITGKSYQDNNHVVDGMTVRRLTPVECERLQGFPDNWTAEGVYENNPTSFEISDTQRYKCIGNAVTVNVIRDIAIKLL